MNKRNDISPDHRLLPTLVELVNAGLWIPPHDIEAGVGEAVGSPLNRMLGAAPALAFGDSPVARLVPAGQGLRVVI